MADNLFAMLQKAQETASTAKYTRHMADYDHALSIPSGPAGQAQRAKIVDEAVAYLKELDNAEFNLQPIVRNRMAKLLMTKGDFAGAKELFQTVINEHGADKDTQTLVKLFERNAGVAIAPNT